MAKSTANKDGTKSRKAPPHAWKPGQSGNPAGAPKRGMSWAEIIKTVGDEAAPGRPDVTMKEAVVRAAFMHAIKANAMIRREIMQRSEPQAGELNIRHDWREEARARGLTEGDVLAE